MSHNWKARVAASLSLMLLLVGIPGFIYLCRDHWYNIVMALVGGGVITLLVSGFYIKLLYFIWLLVSGIWEVLRQFYEKQF